MLLIFTIAFVKEFLDDRARDKADQVTNNKMARRYNPVTKLIENVPWKDLRVGEIVEVGDGEMVPADMAVFSSSGKEGICYVDTCNLDGETNLKVRTSMKKTSGIKLWVATGSTFCIR